MLVVGDVVGELVAECVETVVATIPLLHLLSICLFTVSPEVTPFLLIIIN